MKKITGWVTILLALLLLLLSITPGAGSILVFLVSLGALVLALFSVRKGNKSHFNATLIIVASGVFFVNDSLRIWADPMTMNIKPTMYGIFFTVALVCIIAASELSRDKKTT